MLNMKWQLLFRVRKRKGVTVNKFPSQKLYSHQITSTLNLLLISLIILTNDGLFVNGDSNEDIIDDISTEHIAENCIAKCPDQVRINSTEHMDCGRDCYITLCTSGCELWTDALDSSCNTVCNKVDQDGTSGLYCVMGCNNALNRYFNWLIDEIGTPSAPALVADSLTSTSLSLEWTVPPRLIQFTRGPHVTQSYLVQWRYEEIMGDWKFCRNQSIGDNNSTFYVDNLQPYTKYRFRVALILSANHEKAIFSNQSVIISTLPAGLPSSEPVIVRAVAVDHTRISVSWEPGPFPNGPILSYVLQIKDLSSNGSVILKDISSNKHYVVVEKLTPSTEYSVSVKMRNAIGEGPPAKRTVRTTDQPKYSSDENKFTFILGAEYAIFWHDADFFSHEPKIIYTSVYRIVGIAIHVASRQMFISDETGNVYRKNISLEIDDSKGNYPIITPTMDENYKPLGLSMDWLNNRLYILMESTQPGPVMYQISRCNLDGTGMSVVLAGLRIKPNHFEVDPYDGYLFWVISGRSSDSGLFRLDLADVSNGVKHEVMPQHIMSGEFDLGAFTINHTYSKIMVPLQLNNTMGMVDFDGKNLEDIRTNVQTPLFQKVSSLAFNQANFYWTNGSSFLYEEQHPSHENYYHNMYAIPPDLTVIFVAINGAFAQPIPRPINPPLELQALFYTNYGIVTWQRPQLMGYQGRASWQDWNYELQITNEDTDNSTLVFRHIKGTKYTIRDLKSDTNYRIRVAAYTKVGVGTWSTEFHGRTLKPLNDHTFIWSTGDGLKVTDVIMDNVGTSIPKTDNVTDIAWYLDSYYYVQNYQIVHFNKTTETHNYNVLNVSESIINIAIDTIGHHLYMYSRERHMVIRMNLLSESNRTERLDELFIINAQSLDLRIDSSNGYIFYSSGHILERRRLNGRELVTYKKVEAYVGEQIIGPALDFEHKRVYWINLNNNNKGESTLCSDLMYGTPGTDSLQTYPIKGTSYRGPIHYFDDRLIWLKGDRAIVVGYLPGNNLTVVTDSKLSTIKTFTVVDRFYSDMIQMGGKTVVPLPIESETIKIIGVWNNFSVTWAPAKNVTFGTVFYDILISTVNNIKLFNVTDIQETIVEFNATTQPYTRLDIRIKAYTYWASTNYTQVQLYTPESIPSPPINPRIFVRYPSDPFKRIVEAILRWDSPTVPNGEIQSYELNWWLVGGSKTTVHVNGTVGEYRIGGDVLPATGEIKFHVKARTRMGYGNFTSKNWNVSQENRIPKLIVVTATNVSWLDLDLKKEFPIHSGGPISHVNYLEYENRYYWINENNELISFNGTVRTKIYQFNEPIESMAIDWIERTIYWSEIQIINGTSNIFTLNLNQLQSNLNRKIILHSNHVISNLQIDSIGRKLVWIEMIHRSKLGNLTVYDLNTNSRLSVRCSKPQINTTFDPTINVDTNYSLFDSDVLVIHSGKLLTFNLNESSSCRTINHLKWNESAKNLMTDGTTIFWIVGDRIHAVNLLNKKHYTMSISGISFIKTIYQQKYHRIECLLPPPFNEPRNNPIITSSLIEATERSLILRLPTVNEDSTNQTSVIQINELKRPSGCSLIKYPPIIYSILYTEKTDDSILPNLESVKHETVQTIDSIKTIDKLKPFQNYRFQIGITNFYQMKSGNGTVYGPIQIYKTTPGTPTAPRAVRADTMSPTEALIKWERPIEIIGNCLWYEIYWETQVNGEKNQKRREYNETNLNRLDVLSVSIRDLHPNKLYVVWLKAYTSWKTYSQSEMVEFHTYPEPEGIKLWNKTAYTIDLHILPIENCSRIILVYRIADNGSSVTVYDSQESDNEILSQYPNLHIRNLKPKLVYTFSLRLYYNKSQSRFDWPLDNRFRYETLADVPSAPGKPIIELVSGNAYKVKWDLSMDNGEPIDQYNLESLRSTSQVRTTRSIIRNETLLVEYKEPQKDEWIVNYNGTDNHFIIKHFQPIQEYLFRVRAHNSLGWGGYSEISDKIPNPTVTAESRTYLIYAILTPALIVGTMVFIIVLLYVCNRRLNEKKKFAAESLALRLPDVELANLRELPRGGNFIHSTNILYRVGPLTDADVALLPQIRRSQVTMTCFLGSGAFGEVYEGVVKDVDDEPETRVAIKTLRKGATEQEKMEFLQEAQLMSNFKHDHILRLIGVCFDRDALYIIMDLMQGGDLLSYLRQSRPTVGTPCSLALFDLVSMCVDIASGCRYLEEMHFVHRDLACRNCLVSSIDPINRIVKIGDFGLARDIYKNDYYRKDGEGLLPVRWMSPESLVDGVFTSQSDMWAFGVLCWEIMTLGQQPYPARNNLEVLHYVRNGGRLGQPVDCPELLYDLMLKCWSYRPEERPTFRYCLEQLLILKSNTSETLKITTHSQNHIQNGGIFNRSYMLNGDVNQNHNFERDSKQINDHLLERSESPILITPASSIAGSPPNKPTYLEIIYDPDQEREELCGDGYEIPLTNSLEHDKERTFSNASTVSEMSVCNPINETLNCTTTPPPPPILTVTLPNCPIDDQCSSRETLLKQVVRPPFYANTKCTDRLCSAEVDGKTML